MNPEEIVREAYRSVENEQLEIQQKIRAERLAAYEAEQPTPAELIAQEWVELDEPFADLDRITRG